MIATLSVFGQSKDCYELQHDCILCPKQNTWTRHVTGGGYGSIVTEKFDYKKNALIFTGNTFRFEKPAVKRNKDDMKVLYYENSGFIYEDRGQYYACYAPFAVNYPYHLYINDCAEGIAERNGLKRKPKLEYVGKRLFLVDGELFFKGEGLSFFPVKGYDIKFDMPTLRHLAGNYYVDNNGLYWFGTYIVDRGISPDFHTKQLDSSDGKPADIQIGKCYIAYNDKVYSLDRRNLMPLELNPDSMREYNGHIVTDGRNTYIYGNPPTEREKDKYDFTSWQHIISEKIDLRWNEKEKKLFFPDYEWSANTERVS